METVQTADLSADHHHQHQTHHQQPQPQQQPPPPTSQQQHLHHHHHHRHNKRQLRQPSQSARPQQQPTNTSTTTIATAAATTRSQQPKESFDTSGQPIMAYQHKHALHRLRRLKKRSPHRDLVISFVPRLRISIINRLDFFHRYSKLEQEVLSCFDFLDELVLNYCDEGCVESPRYSPKLYDSLIYELI